VTRYFALFGPWREDYIYILASYFVKDATKFGHELVVDFDAWKDSEYHSEYTPHRARLRSPFNDGIRLDRPNCAKNFTEFKERFEKLFVTVTPKEHAQKQLRELTKTGANASITVFNQSFRLIAGRTGLGNETLILFYKERIGSRIHELVTLMDDPKNLNNWMRRAEKVGLSLEKSARVKKKKGLFAPPTQTVRTQAVRVPVQAPAASPAAGPLSQPRGRVDWTFATSATSLVTDGTVAPKTRAQQTTAIRRRSGWCRSTAFRAWRMTRSRSRFGYCRGRMQRGGRTREKGRVARKHRRSDRRNRFVERGQLYISYFKHAMQHLLPPLC
jgi:hypothetical protein